MTNLLANNIHIGQISTTAASKYIKTGELKALGILSPRRSKVVPNVPTAKELGFGVEFATSRGLVAPKGTSAAVIDHYVTLLKAAASDPSVQKQMAAKGTDIVFISKKEYGAFMKKSFENMKKLAVKIGLYKG
jgi:tripartite-type tricarboxylate transporter receptor subunit TctC